MAMRHDVARCSACRACMVACKQWHDLPADMSTPFKVKYQSHADLTPFIGLLSARKGYATMIKEAFSFNRDDLIFLLKFPLTLVGIEAKMPKQTFL